MSAFTPEHKAERNKVLTASDACYLYGLGFKGRSLDMVAAEKRGEIEDKWCGSALTAMGNFLEPDVAYNVRQYYGEDFTEQEWVVRGDLGATLDMRSFQRIVEIKTYPGFPSKATKLDLEDGVPDKYFVQLIHQMAASGAEIGAVANLFAGESEEDGEIEMQIWLREWRREDVAPIIDEHIAAVEAFWTDQVSIYSGTKPIEKEWKYGNGANFVSKVVEFKAQKPPIGE